MPQINSARVHNYARRSNEKGAKHKNTTQSSSLPVCSSSRCVFFEFFQLQSAAYRRREAASNNVVGVRLLIERLRVHHLLDVIKTVTASKRAACDQRGYCGDSDGSCSSLDFHDLCEGRPRRVVAREAAVGEESACAITPSAAF